MKSTGIVSLHLFALGIAVLAGCGSPRSATKISSHGDLLAPRARLDYAIYFKSKTPPDSQAVSDFVKTNATALDNADNHLSLVWSSHAQTDYPPPDSQALEFFARGLDDSEKRNTAKITHVIGLEFDVANEPRFGQQKLASQLVLDLAEKFDGYIWDESARVICTPAYWRKNILGSWETATTIISKNMVIHQYTDGGLERSVTVGMAKFGLPDLVVEGSARSSSKPVANTINILCQFLSENPTSAIDGKIELDLSRLKASSFKDSQTTGLYPDGKGKGIILLENAIRQDGDPDNRLWSLKFRDFDKRDEMVKQDEFFAGFFGSIDSTKVIKHDEELLQASAEAKQHLPGLKARFQKGLGLGEVLLVKVPFEIPGNGGNEWMWVEVVKWKGDQIRGILQNDPDRIPELKSGQEVVVEQSTIFDYLLQKADGTSEGNETSKIIERMEGQ